MKVYKRFMRVAAAVTVAGAALWFERVWRGPAAVDFAEVGEAVIERSWLTVRGTNGAARAEMVFSAGEREGIATNFFRGGMWLPGWTRVDALGVSLVRVWMDGFTGSVGSSRRGRLVWFSGVPDFESGVYSRSGRTLSFEGFRVCLDGEGLERFERLDEGDYVGWSFPCTNFTGVVDASGFGVTDGDGTLTGFAFQGRKWRGVLTNEFEEMRGALTNLQGAMLWGATPSQGWVAEYERSWSFETNNTAYAAGWTWDEAFNYGWGAISNRWDESDTFTAQTNYFGGSGQKSFSVWEHYLYGNVMVDWNYYTPNYYLGGVRASARFKGVWFQAIDFDWPCYEARTNGVVTRADVYLVGADPRARFSVWERGGVTNVYAEPPAEDLQWDIEYLPRAQWETNGTYQGFGFMYPELRIAVQKGVKVGEVGTPFSVGVVEYPWPGRGDMVESVFDDYPDPGFEDKQWFFSRQCGVMFVIVPVVDFRAF